MLNVLCKITDSYYMQRVGNVVVAMQMKNLVLQDVHKAHEDEGDETTQGATGGPP